MTKRRIGLFAAFMAVALLGLSASAQERRSGLDPRERALLGRGELVRRELVRRQGRARLYGGVSFQRVRAPIDAVWAKASDPNALTDLIPSLDRTRVVETRGSSRVIYMHHSYGIGETAYYVRMDLDHRTRALAFHLDTSRPHDIRAGYGFMTLSTYRGQTMVTWGMQLDPGVGVLGEVFGPALNGWLLKPPSCLRDAVEPGREPSC